MGLIGFRSNTSKSIRYNIGFSGISGNILRTGFLFNPFGSADWTISYDFGGGGNLFNDATLLRVEIEYELGVPSGVQPVLIDGDGITSDKIVLFDDNSVPGASMGSLINMLRIGNTRTKMPLTYELFQIIITWGSPGPTGGNAEIWLTGA